MLDAQGTPYIPSIGRDGTGRYWLAWYALGKPNGLRIVQIDPASLQPAGPVQIVPGSSSIDNNNSRLALACAQACRLVYHGPNRRILSWTPGEASPALVATAINPTPWLAAIHLPGGRLWVAWYDRGPGAYRAVRGDAAGRGGKPVSLGRPAGIGGYAIAAVAAGANVVLVANWNSRGTQFGRYVNVVRPR